MHKIVSWDTCVFLAKFNQETEKPLDQIDAILEQVRDRKISLLVSTICAAEILDRVGVQQDHGRQFLEYLKRENVIPVDVDLRIARKAAVFRQNGAIARKKGIIKEGFKAPDAIIAATASIYKADVLHTFDPILNSLSKTDYIDGLLVEKPFLQPHEKSLFDDLPVEND